MCSSDLKKKEIVVTEIPYQVNKTRLIERIADIAKQKIVEGITEIRDESNRKGMRIVIELRKDVNAEVMLNNLYKYTQLQTSFGINMIALVNNKPQLVPLKLALTEYIKHQIEIITRRTKFDLEKSLARLHILEGYLIALDNIDEIVAIIRNNKDGSEKEQLIERFNLTSLQAQAILDMQLKRLSGLNRDKTTQEYNTLKALVEDLEDILASDERKRTILKEELTEIKNKYSTPRRTEISLHEDLNIENEDLIPVEDTIITITNKGYCKRMPIDNYHSQSRGGIGIKGIKTSDDDEVKFIFPTSTHDYGLYFTNKGRVYTIKGYQIPEGSRTSKGLPIVNILNLQEDEEIAAVEAISDFDDSNKFLFFCTTKGIVKRTSVSQFAHIRTTGIIAINLDENDSLLDVRVTDNTKDIMLGASNGKSIRFEETQIRPTGRNSAGVRGMRISEDDKIVGFAVIEDENAFILAITENGYGKKTLISEYRPQNRGGSGIKTVQVTQKNGPLTALRTVTDDNDLLITTDKGIIIRMHVAGISTSGRATQGVRVMRLRDDQKISSVAIVDKAEDAEEIAAIESENPTVDDVSAEVEETQTIVDNEE